MNRWTMAALALVGAACSTESASEYKTSEMVAKMSATATGDGRTVVKASLHPKKSSLVYLQLTADDAFEASIAGETREMDDASLLGAVTYSASFGKDIPETEVRVRLTRRLDAGAPSSTVRLPAPFTVAPPAKPSYSRAEPIALSWSSDPSGDPMSVRFSGPCIQSYETELGAGVFTYTLPAGTLRKAEGASVADSCDLRVDLERTRQGAVDSAFDHGTFVATQQRSTTLQTKP